MARSKQLPERKSGEDRDDGNWHSVPRLEAREFAGLRIYSGDA
jgi:hypothetical protein